MGHLTADSTSRRDVFFPRRPGRTFVTANRSAQRIGSGFGAIICSRRTQRSFERR